jgi:hypothetical protein
MLPATRGIKKSMSQERRQKRNEKLGITKPARNWGRIVITAALIAVALGVAFYFDNRSRHKYDAFARCLNQSGAKMYGAWWCPHCVEQKEKFGASFEYAPYVECGIKGDLHGKAQVCTDANIKGYPTWQFPPTGERVEHVVTLQELSNRTGCALP